MYEFDQGIGEITDFKLIHEYIFAIVREFYFIVILIYYAMFLQKNFNSESSLFVSYKRKPFVQAKFIPAMDGNEVELQINVLSNTVKLLCLTIAT